jgi:hypothetical protein
MECRDIMFTMSTSQLLPRHKSIVAKCATTAAVSTDIPASNVAESIKMAFDFVLSACLALVGTFSGKGDPIMPAARALLGINAD